MSDLAQRLESIGDELGVVLPIEVHRFLEGLEQPQLRVANDEWEFWAKDPELAEQMVPATGLFRKEWNLAGVVLADNGLGDYLLLLPSATGQSFDAAVYVMAHESGEIRIYAPSLAKIHTAVDLYAIPDEDCVYRLNDDGEVEEGPAFADGMGH